MVSELPACQLTCHVHTVQQSTENVLPAVDVYETPRTHATWAAGALTPLSETNKVGFRYQVHAEQLTADATRLSK